MNVEPVTVTLTRSLLVQFEDVAVKAVIAKDLSSLRALHEMKVDLTNALTQSVKLGFHEITRELRAMNVPVTRYTVDWAISKSPESYWSLCADGQPIHIEDAFDVAMREGKYKFVAEVMDRFNLKVTDSTLAAMFRPKRPLTRAFIEKIFESLPDVPWSAEALWRAAQIGTPRIVDRALRVSPRCPIGVLLAIAIKSHNEPVVRDLEARPGAVESRMVATYVRAPYLKEGLLEDEKNRIDAEFLRTFARHGVSLSLNDITPLALAFMTLKAGRVGIGGWNYEPNAELEFMAALVAALDPAERERLPDLIDRMARELTMPRLQERMRPTLSAQVREIIEQVQSMENDKEDFQP